MPEDADSRIAARRRPASRIAGVDAARGIALIGMFVAHVAPAVASAQVTDLIAIADERPRLLFALTAGVGLGLITGATRPRTDDRAELRRQVAIRAAILLAIGLFAIAVLRPLVVVILDVYGIAFLVMVPLLFIPARAALAAGAALLAVAPAVAALAERDPTLQAAATGELGIVVEWLLTGSYPVIIWVPVMLIGLGLARSDVAATATVRRYALAGVLAASTCLPLAAAMPENQVLGADPAADWMIPARASLETVGNVGVGLAVLAGTIALTALAVPRVRRVASTLLSPITAMGTMPLTIYTGQLVVLSMSKRVGPGGVATDDSWPLLVGLIVGSMVFAWLWRRYVGRGPLEMLLRAASGRDRSFDTPGGSRGREASAGDV
ncbi:hypothetical protein GCM10017608_29310 [Agromyces luteolus]|uniref:DUF418 domain-containing protein n=1 Tax=Agromyces luteolus TaxID=88373 RepID=A0A7C9HG93_9MICO|nr:DUF418 domain-containing protein [Agromyces luteolus]MUN06046.1 DUF418 domain-containing protein [Agromyces luteolus]GLK28996.1 hypothetical protein GCM10017608_29310 [Agromyces luteolus]